MSTREDTVYDARLERERDCMEFAGYCQYCGGRAMERGDDIRCDECGRELGHPEVGPKQPEYPCPICKGIVCKQGNEAETPCDDCVSAGYTAPLEWKTVKAHPAVEWLTEQVAVLQDLKATVWQPPKVAPWQWSVKGATSENRGDWFDGDYAETEEAAKRDAEMALRRTLPTLKEQPRGGERP